MKLLNAFKNFTQKLSKKTIATVATLTMLAGFGAGFVQADFFPVRPVFDYNKGSASSNCADPNDPGFSGGRCGSMTGPVFNSFINTPSYGDERAFADARRSDQIAAGSYKDNVQNVTDGSREVVIRTYVHNNANSSLNASGAGIAKGTQVRILLPTATSNGLRARSYISATNASLVEDTVDFTSTKNFKLEYVAGSAKLFNNTVFKSGTKLNDSIVTTGALIGDDKLDGEVPGCFEYEASVQITVRVIPVEAPKVEFTKQVRKSGDKTWVEEVTTKPGDTVQWLMTTKNIGTTQLDGIIVRDILPPNMKLVAGTVKRVDATRNQVLSDVPLFDGGFNVGSYGAGSGVYVMFDAKTLDTFTECEVRIRNRAFVKSTQTTEQTDTADVVIKKENCVPPQKLVTCDSLTAPKLTLKVGESTEFTASGKATNTTITGYKFAVNGNVVQDSASNKYTFKQDATGTYTVMVTVKSPIGDVTSPACVKTVDVTKDQVAPVYRCESLTLSKASLKTGEKVKVSVRFSAKDGASFKQATFDFGDSATFATNTATGDVVETEHAYTAKGTYGIKVKLDFNVNGQTKSIEGGNCVGQVTVVTEKCPIPGKEQFEKNDTVNCNEVKGVTTIPDTGAGSIAGIFAGITLAGAFMHNLIARRSVRQ